MATHEYWSAVEEKGLRRHEITCAWFLVLAAVVALQIITSLLATPFCSRPSEGAVAETGIGTSQSGRADKRILAAVDAQPCRR
jgi:hypothetical protein